MLAGLRRHFQQQRTGTAGWVINLGAANGVFGSDADNRCDDPTDLGRGMELPFALAALGGEMAHEVFIGIAQNVVMFSAVV